ncbi:MULTISPECIES: arginine--tRNA ligase [Methanothermobacter]|uniref:arginine--tRNA ligase n=1 Tax=Methanothermobacter TaxID=145260 RepID=UPI0011CB4441|nr:MULTISPECIES: arginine--tRNA ligase [unclassified Methanothermobacter]QEF94454.1 arginine--tRNA ligase [Methanothermobacter sp. KEPCO-1]QHN07602.1 arginine--tRNA ligase [Methanothermobacter sp. THM-2]
MFRYIENRARDSIIEALEKLQLPVPSEIKLEEPPNPQLGDLASTVAFELAGELKRPPMEITSDIMSVIETPEIFEAVESKGPYINFFVDYGKLSGKLLEIMDDDYGSHPERGEMIILEHTSANPNGPLHIGHIRNAIIGDSLARILRKAGYQVETQYYVNDMGRQIAMIVWGLLNLQKNLDDYPGDKRDHRVGRLYLEVNQKLREDPGIKDEVDELLRKYEAGENEDTFREVVKYCLDGMKETMQRLHVHHDRFVWEGELVRDGTVGEVIESLRKTGLTRENEVLYLDLEDFGIEKELVLTRSDGTSLYSTRDIAYHLQKSREGDILIDVLGSDHKLAAEQVGIAVDLLGGKKPEVIFYEFITLPEGSMSTRRGVFISVDELMDEAHKRALEEVKKRRELPDDVADEIAEAIGNGAIRYYIGRLSPEKHIVFRWDEALSFERGCASIQYAHARACKLLKKASFNGDEDIEDAWKPEEDERELVRLLARFPVVVEEAAMARRVHPVAQYVQDLANAFNSFYRSTPVIGSEFEGARLRLVDSVRIVIRNALGLLGIHAPETM